MGNVEITFNEFQQDLTKELIKLVSDVETMDTSKKRVLGVNGYNQQLPEIRTGDDIPFPYLCTQILEAKTDEEDNDWCWVVAVALRVGVYWDDPLNQGHQKVLEIIQRIVNRLAKNRCICEQGYMAMQDMHWELQESDEWFPPCYFGEIDINFLVPKVRKETPFI